MRSCGPVRRSLAHFGESEPGTILVLGSHGRSGSRIGSLGSVSRDVVRRAECPSFSPARSPGPDRRLRSDRG